MHEPGQRARYSAVLGILGALLVPFIHVSVYLFRTLHPLPVVLKPGRPDAAGVDAGRRWSLRSSSSPFFFVALLWHRYALARLAEAHGPRRRGAGGADA